MRTPHEEAASTQLQLLLVRSGVPQVKEFPNAPTGGWGFHAKLYR